MADSVLDITDEQFETAVLQSEKPVMVKDGKIAEQLVGMVGKEKLEESIKKII